MKKDERGQSMVETALLLPIFLLILVGIIDFGKVTYSYAHLHMAAQETVRIAGFGDSDAAIKTFAQDYVHLGDKSKLQVEITPGEAARKSGEYVTVKLSYPYRFITPIISKLFPSSFMIESDSTIRIE
jgi:Flp pilus assembly protein TadG